MLSNCVAQKKSLCNLMLPLSYNPDMQLESSHLLFCLNNCLLLEVSDHLDQSAVQIINHVSAKVMILKNWSFL
jgi:hypothetical protein